MNTQPNTRTNLLIASAVTGLCLSISAGSALAQPRYRLVDLPPLPGGLETRATAISDSGFVVGSSGRTGQGGLRACRWDLQFVTDLGALPGSNGTSAANAVNNAGVAAGSGLTSSFQGHAILFQNGSAIDLGTLNGAASAAMGINDVNDVVGWSNTAAVNVHAFLWRNNLMYDLGVMNGGRNETTWMQANNNLGEGAGYSMDTSVGTKQAFSYDDRTAFTNLAAAQPCCSEGRDINSFREVVGQATAPNGEQHAYRWTAALKSYDLGTLGGTQSIARGNNDLGQIVGSSRDAFNSDQAFLWDNGVMYNLNSLVVNPNGWIFTSAADINDAGEIVGVGTDPNGRLRGFLLVPDDQLRLLGPNPGTAGTLNTFKARGASNGGRVYFVYSLRTGSTSVPPCPGLMVDLDRPIIISSATANSNGEASIKVNVPGSAYGLLVHFQAVDVSACRVSNRLVHQFP